MRGKSCALLTVLAGMLFFLQIGCSSVSKGTDAASDTSNLEIPASMIDDVMRRFVREAMLNPGFRRYLTAFRASHGGRNPVVKVSKVTLNPPSDDVELFRDRLLWPFLVELQHSDLVEISDVEGLLGTKQLRDGMTGGVASAGKRQPRAAAVALSLDVKSTVKQDGRLVSHEFEFKLGMADIQDGQVFWRCIERRGFVENGGMLKLW